MPFAREPERDHFLCVYPQGHPEWIGFGPLQHLHILERESWEESEKRVVEFAFARGATVVDSKAGKNSKTLFFSTGARATFYTGDILDRRLFPPRKFGSVSLCDVLGTSEDLATARQILMRALNLCGGRVPNITIVEGLRPVKADWLTKALGVHGKNAILDFEAQSVLNNAHWQFPTNPAYGINDVSNIYASQKAIKAGAGHPINPIFRASISIYRG